jgi:hypothetical protein
MYTLSMLPVLQQPIRSREVWEVRYYYYVEERCTELLGWDGEILCLPLSLGTFPFSLGTLLSLGDIYGSFLDSNFICSGIQPSACFLIGGFVGLGIKVLPFSSKELTFHLPKVRWAPTLSRLE